MAPVKLGRPRLKGLDGSRLAVLIVRAGLIELMVRSCLTVDDFAELVALVRPISSRTVRSDLALRNFLRDHAVGAPMPLKRVGLYWRIFSVLAQEPHGSPPCTELTRAIDDALTDEDLTCYTFERAPSERVYLVPGEPSRRYQQRRQALAHYLRSVRSNGKERFGRLLLARGASIIREAEAVRRGGVSFVSGMDEGARVSREWAIRYANLAATLHLRSRHTAAGLLRHTSYGSTPFTDGEAFLWKYVHGVGLGGARVAHAKHVRLGGEAHVAVPIAIDEGET